jgi:hypothetical protein
MVNEFSIRTPSPHARRNEPPPVLRRNRSQTPTLLVTGRLGALAIDPYVQGTALTNPQEDTALYSPRQGTAPDGPPPINRVLFRRPDE